MATATMKIRRALESAARLPVRVSIGSRAIGRSNAPRPGELPVVILRLQVVRCSNLLIKDKSGSADPFVVVSLLNTRNQTPVSKRTVNPVYPAKDATFDFPIYLSLADRLGVLELVVWNKDMLLKEYLGEVSLLLEDWFVDNVGNPRPYAFDDPQNTPFTLNLVSSRANTHASGTVEIKMGFAHSPSVTTQEPFEQVFARLVKMSRPSLVSAPPTEGVGTVRSHSGGPAFVDDGGLSSDDGSVSGDDAEYSEDLMPTPTASALSTPFLEIFNPLSATRQTEQTMPATSILGEDQGSPLNATYGSPTTPTPPSVSQKLPSGFIPRMKFHRRVSGLGSNSTATQSPPVQSAGDVSSQTQSLMPPMTRGMESKHVRTESTEKIRRFRKSWVPGSHSGSRKGSGSDTSTGKREAGYSFKGDNDIVGIIMLEIQKAEDLPRLKNMTRLGWDMDPFVVISFGKKVFRTRVIRHSLNPVWDEKLLFHVRRYETSFKLQLTILDWDKLSANDHIGDVSFDIGLLMDSAPQPDLVTGLYTARQDGDHPMKEFKVDLLTTKGTWEASHHPILSFRAKYQPYDALRQRFWRQYLKQYDTDDTNTLSHLEMTSMLDSLGSTLSQSTVSSFFTRFGKKPYEDDLTVEEAIQCLETELGRPHSEKKRLDTDDSQQSSACTTPILSVTDRQGKELDLDKLNFAGPSMSDEGDRDKSLHEPVPPPSTRTQPMQQPLEQVIDVNNWDLQPSESSSDDLDDDIVISPPAVADADVDAPQPKKKARFRKVPGVGKARAKVTNKTKRVKPEDFVDHADSVERVINVQNCPLCHRPRMSSKAEMDIVTHLAICASSDWDKIGRVVVGNFVTASQAQRKWYTKVISKVSSGDYRLGANSANIIVQDRITGQLQEEKMQVYVRLGIRLLYKGINSRMEGARARRLLKSLSIKQGIHYDSPTSARDIPSFIEFHGLKIEEILDPLDSFKTFNQFFYRKLKPSARLVERPDDPHRLVSVADCRLMAFETVSQATRIWIKGREFSVARLLGDVYKHQAGKYEGGALGIFRLAPQDYHRFHSPVSGTIGPISDISGEYYTVNPQAIRTALDVYGENVRKVVPIDSPEFGRVMAVCIGAMMVGTIEITVKEGERVEKGQEFGYFAFGGSTVVLLFEKGVLSWDEDLLLNGRASLETLVRVGMGIGTRASLSSPDP